MGLVLCTTANAPEFKGAVWHAAANPGEGYVTTLCGWLVIAYHLERRSPESVECPDCRKRLGLT